MPPQATSGSITKACAYCSSIESDSRRSANQPKKPIAAHNVENSGIRARIGFRFSRLKDNKSGAISSTPPESPSHQRNHAGANAAQGIWPVRTRLKAPPLAVTVMPTTAANANAGPSLPRLKSGSKRSRLRIQTASREPSVLVQAMLKLPPQGCPTVRSTSTTARKMPGQQRSPNRINAATATPEAGHTKVIRSIGSQSTNPNRAPA